MPSCSCTSRSRSRVAGLRPRERLPHLREEDLADVVEVHAAGVEAAVLEYPEHALGREVYVRRELIGVPAQQRVAAVHVQAAEDAVVDGVRHLVLEGVARQRGMVHLYIDLKILQQVKLP